MFVNIASLLIIVVCIAGIAVVSVLYGTYNTHDIPNDYAIVFDAGSSGSRMHVYEWRAGFSAARGDDLTVHQAVYCKNKDKGLDKIKSQDELISKYSDCIQQAKDYIPQQRRNRTYIFLAATAGMRLLELQNKTMCDETFNFVRSYFRSLNFLFKNDSQVRTLSGQEEGTNAWIAANYFEQNFKVRRNEPTKDTKGILDLGGASTQIVFVPKKPHNVNNSQFFSDIRIYGTKYQPYSHSFICRGLNEMKLLYQTYLLITNDYEAASYSSCFPKNSVHTANTNQIFSSPCANGFILNNSNNFDSSRVRPDMNLEFNGLSDKQTCEEQIGALLPKNECQYGQCSLDNIYQPNTTNNIFWGFSNYFYAINNTAKLLNHQQTYTINEFRNATDFICSRDLNQLTQLNVINEAGITENFLINQCFLNVYTLTLLSRYGITSFDSLKFAEKVNGYSLNWSLGYLINELNRDDFLPYEELPRKMTFPVFLTLAILFSGIFLLALTLVMRKYCKSAYEKVRTTETVPTA